MSLSLHLLGWGNRRCQVVGAGVNEIVDLLLEVVDAGVTDLVVVDAVLVLILLQNVAEGPEQQYIEL